MKIWTFKWIINEGMWRWKPIEIWHRAPTKGKAQPEVKAEVCEGLGGIKRTDGQERLAATAEHAQ